VDRPLAEPVLLGAIIVLAVVLRFYRLGHQGFWFDEANTALLVHFSPGKMLGLIPQSESTPPLYYCVAWVWARVFGFREAGLRSLSAVCGVLVVPVAYGLGRALSTRRVALVAAALTACNPLLIWYSQEARSYEMLVLLTSLALLSCARARADPTPRRLAVWAGTSALALSTHYYAVLAVLPQAAWLLAGYRLRRSVRIAVGLVLLCGAALIPLALSQNGTGNDSWISHAPLGVRLAQVVPQLLIGTDSPARTLVKWLAYAAAVIALVLLITRITPSERRPALIGFGLAVAAFVLALLLVAAGFDDLITRNIIVVVVPILLALAGGYGARRASWLGLAAAGVLCVIGIVATVGIARERRLERPDWRPVAQAFGPAPRPGAPGRAILVQHYAYMLPLSLYLPHLQRLRAPGQRVDEFDVVSFSSPQQPLCWWGAACNLIPSAMQSSYPLAGFRVAWRRRVLQFTILHMVARRPEYLTPRVVNSALFTTHLRHDILLYQP
jgi:mannosyltransferase